MTNTKSDEGSEYARLLRDSQKELAAATPGTRAHARATLNANVAHAIAEAVGPAVSAARKEAREFWAACAPEPGVATVALDAFKELRFDDGRSVLDMPAPSTWNGTPWEAEAYQAAFYEQLFQLVESAVDDARATAAEDA